MSLQAATIAVCVLAVVATGCHTGAPKLPHLSSVPSTAPRATDGPTVSPATGDHAGHTANDKHTAPTATDNDDDRDNIIDLYDQCPDERETYNGVADEDGCPDTSGPVGRPSLRGLVRERTVTGPARPADCSVFRRILSSAGQIEHWYFEFPAGESRIFLYTDEVERVVRVVSSQATTFDIISEPAYGETATLALKRAQFVLDSLIASGAPADRLLVAGVSPARTGRARVGFRTRDRSLITTSYRCYDRDSH